MYLRTIGRRVTQMIAYFLVMNSKRCKEFIMFIFYYIFMFLYILQELLLLAESRFGRAPFAGTQNNHKPIMGYLGHGSGLLLK